MVATGLLGALVHPAAGRMRVPRPVGDFSSTPTALGAPAPLLGQHTDMVLAELGIDETARTDLRRRGVIA